MKLSYISWLFLLLTCASLTTFAQKRSLSSIADEAFEAKQYAIAVEKYQAAYTKVKGNRAEKDRILFKMSECYRYMNNPKKAIPLYKRLIKAKYYQVEPIIFYHFADFLRYSGEFEDAEDNYKEYLKLDPDNEMVKRKILSLSKTKEWIDNPTPHEIQNVKALNTEYNDWMPKFVDKEVGDRLLFTSSRPLTGKEKKDVWTGQFYSDLFLSQQDKKGFWSDPFLFEADGVINGPFHEGEAEVNKKMTFIVFSRCIMLKGEDLRCAIYQSKKKGKGWEEPRKIDLGDSNFNYLHPSLSDDELTMYFSSDKPGGQGDYDIWQATRESKKSDKWTRITNLGKEVNTPGKEQFPVLRTDSLLYFSSNGHDGLGGYDLFESRLNNGKGETPRNLGYPINTQYDEIGIVFYPNSSSSLSGEEKGFFSSNREGGKGGDDIYSFYRAPLIFSIRGKVRDDLSMQFVDAARVRLIGSDGSSIETRTDRRGAYVFDSTKVNVDVAYRIAVGKMDYLNNEAKESTVGLRTNRDFVCDVRLRPVPKEPVVLPEIRYDLAKWDLKEQYEDSLSDLLVVLMNNPSLVVELRSHTDSRPFHKVTNDSLSQFRAEEVVQFLVARGVESERLVPKGYADRVPRTLQTDMKVKFKKKSFTFPKGVTLTDDYINKLRSFEEKEAAHQLNRRTEFRILRSDFMTIEERDSLDMALKNARLLDMVAPIEPLQKDLDVPIVYTDKVIKVTMIHGTKAQMNIVFNGANVPVVYEERYRDVAVISWDLAMEFLKTGRITKKDFQTKEDAFNEDGEILDNSVLFFQSATIGTRSWTDKYQVIVQKGLPYKMIINKNGLKDFGDFTFDKQKGEIIFE